MRLKLYEWLITFFCSFSPKETGSTNSKLSTFSSTGGGTGKSSVQMRRTTNKRGKTAPAPPKRTRYTCCHLWLYTSCTFAFDDFNVIDFVFHFVRSLLSSSRDSTYRDDDSKCMDEFNTNGTIAKSSSCSSFLIDILFRGIFCFHKPDRFRFSGFLFATHFCV